MSENNNQFLEVEYEESTRESVSEGISFEEESNVTAADPSESTPAHHIRKAGEALNTLKNVVRGGGWKKILKHKSGVIVYSKPSGYGNSKLPIFMGQHEIEGFPPQSVFSVIGMRRLWDELYEEGNLVENLDDTTSLTYMVMQGLAGSKTRDFSLVERVDCSSNGTIFFVSTSVDTSKIPPCVGKVRANVKLNGWILEPISDSPPITKVTYVLQSDVRGWIPSVFAKKYLSRRPLVLNTIKSYLEKNGPPPVILVSPQSSRRTSLAAESLINNGRINKEDKKDMDTMETKFLREKILFENEDETYSPKVSNVYDDEMYSSSKASSVHMNREARVAPEYNLNIMHLNGDEEIPDFSFSQSQTASVNGEDVSSKNLPELLSVSPEASSDSEEEIVVIPEPKKQAIVHRHTESVKNALKNLKSLYNNDNWVLYTENKNAKVYTIDGSKSTPIMRGDATYIGYTPDDILSVVASLDFKKLWDDRFEEGATYERWSLDDTLTRAAVKGTFPVSGRDMSLINTVERDPETGIIWFVNTSVIDPAIPVNKKYVRAELSTAGWILKPKKDESGTIKSVDTTYIVDIDIKLDSLPMAILKSISLQTPMCVAKVDEVMQKYGFPPYMKKLTGELKRDEFNIKTFQCDFSLKVDEGGIIEIQTSVKMYPNGFDVSVKPENRKVELAHDDQGLIRLKTPVGTDSHEIKVMITKNTYKGMKITYNQTQKIPVFSPEEAVEPTVSLTRKVKKIKRNVKHESSNSKEPTREPVREQAVKEPISEQAIKEPIREQAIKEPIREQAIKEPVGEPVIKAIDTGSNESATDAPPVSRRSNRRPKSYLGNTDTHRLSMDKPTLHNKSKDEIVALKTSRRKTVDRNSVIIKDEIPASKISKRKTIGGDSSIISRHAIDASIADYFKNVKLGSQQIGLMFASMILAYYAGKISNCYAQ